VSAAPPSQGSSSELSVDIVDTFELLREDWIRLATDSNNLFATWEWTSTWWRCFGREGTQRIASCRAPDGRLVAIIPLHRQVVHGLQILRFLGHGPGDELGPVCAPRDRARVAHSLRRFLGDELKDWNLFLGEKLPGSENWHALLGASVLDRRATPIMRPAGGGWEDFLASRSANFRQQVRRRERNVFRRHDAQYRLVTRSDRLQSELDILFRLHRRRWGRDLTGFTRYEEFHRQFAELADDRGWLRLWFLEFGKQAVAAWYGFRFANVEYYYQAGRDPQAVQEAAGFVLLSHTMRAAIEDGVREYRLLEGDEAYKYRFATEDLGLQTVGLAKGLAGRLALLVGAASLRSNRTANLARRTLAM
jgi:CelD/BcsL family acetyltransferase involved in cellulose biosynthesis